MKDSEGEQRTITIYLEVKTQPYSFPSVKITTTRNNKEIRVTDANAYAILLNPYNSELMVDRYLFEFEQKTGNSDYEAPLIPGEYLLVASKNRLEEQSIYFEAEKGEMQFSVLMDEVEIKDVKIKAIDFSTGEPIYGVKLLVIYIYIYIYR